MNTGTAEIIRDAGLQVALVEVIVTRIQAERCVRHLGRVGGRARNRAVRSVRELVRLVRGDGWLPRCRLSLLRYALSEVIEKRGEHRKWQDYVASVGAFRPREGRAA
jgi:hypothetical protein